MWKYCFYAQVETGETGETGGKKGPVLVKIKIKDCTDYETT